jgi:hypothetical protein
MGKIYSFLAAGKVVSAASVLIDLQAKEASGAIRSFMFFTEGADGKTTFGMTGGYATRLQLAAFTLVKATSLLSDRMMEAGTLGRTGATPFIDTIPRRPSPPHLKGQP